MFATLFGGKRSSRAWKKTEPKVTVISAQQIARALRGKTLTIPGKGCTVHALGFTISFTVHPVVVGGDVTATIVPARRMKLPSHIGTIILAEHNGSVRKSFGGTGVAVINGVVKGNYTLSLA